MNFKEIEDQEKESELKKSFFSRSHLFVRLSFLFGITTILLSVLHVLIAGVIVHLGIWANNLFCSLISTLAITGIILGGLSFRNGKNIFTILGFIFNIIAVLFQIWSFYMINTSF
ncbi:MAG: hypothetical protein FK730_08255 [Asgard group archaeon]|nr:hypothetical protein [Asgard group archaeon]